MNEADEQQDPRHRHRATATSSSSCTCAPCTSAPEEVIAAIKVRFLGNLDARTLELRINDIEAALRKELPRLRRIYIEPGFNEEPARASLNVPPAARS